MHTPACMKPGNRCNCMEQVFAIYPYAIISFNETHSSFKLQDAPVLPCMKAGTKKRTIQRGSIIQSFPGQYCCYYGKDDYRIKMKVTGIIMECNPFHEGHAYIIEEARRQTGADYIIAAMSGDFVQRGEPAIFDKYLRAAQILSAGADLVLELPLYTACGSAELFAQGGISLLDRLGVVTDLCFGSEGGDTDYLQHCAKMILALDSTDKGAAAPLFHAQLRKSLKSGLSFPAARSLALEAAASAVSQTGPHFQGLPSSPNDLLAVEYCRALLSMDSGIRPHAVRRISVPSASEHRRDLLRTRTGSWVRAVPRAPESGSGQGSPAAKSSLPFPESGGSGNPGFPVSPDDFSAHLLYALQMQQTELDSFVDVTEDLADRIRNLLPQYRTYTGFVDLLKTKNVTRTRVSRALLHILLMMKKDRLAKLQSAGTALYARPLAFRKSAAPLLTAVHENARIPFVSKPAAAKKILSSLAYSFLQEVFRAEELYGLTLRSLDPSVPGPVPRAVQRRLFVL